MKGKLPERVVAWQMYAPSEPLKREEFEISEPKPEEVVVKIAGCGLCHTDLSFLYGGVKTKTSLPLTLGHEISGQVICTGEKMSHLLGKEVVIPAVLPCGECELCKKGRLNMCSRQVMPGNDINGGFATHVTVPGTYLCPLDLEGRDFNLWELSVIADAVTTPYQSATRAKVSADDLVIIIGVGGIGTYGVQVALSKGAKVIALDIDPKRLEQFTHLPQVETLNVQGKDERTIRKEVRELAKRLGAPLSGWKVLEMSGTPSGQLTAWTLMTPISVIGIVGFTMEKVQIRLSNLMAMDADAFGNWGCDPNLYPEVVQLVLENKIKIKPFISKFSLEDINKVIEMVRTHKILKRAVLVP
jgi:6-hydroxycyclohex-1-ene-1-carbonyl-CoA dehydrogenase